MSVGESRERTCLIAVAAVAALAAARVAAHPHAGPTATHEHRDFGLEITITDERVRYDVVLSNACLNLVVPRDRRGLRLAPAGERFAFRDPAQEQAERAAFERVFTRHNPVRADGIELVPQLADMYFLPAVDATGPGGHADAPPDAHVTVDYPLPLAPREVQLGWDLYPPVPARDIFGEVTPFELVARLDAGGESRIVVFTKEQPTITWRAPQTPPSQRIAPAMVTYGPRRGRVPVAGIVLLAAGAALGLAGRKPARRRWALPAAVLCGIAGVTACGTEWGSAVVAWPGARVAVHPEGEAAGRLCGALVRNIYRAFDFQTESDIYDVLAESVDGPLLERIYQEVYASLIAREQGGAVSRVKDVEILAAEPGPAEEGFAVRCRWRVYGVVYHWGHVHERVNEYAARYVLAPREGRWKIVAASVSEQQRVASPQAREAGGG
jgi:hypothetical protein